MADRYAFNVTWMDPSSKVEWAYILLHTPHDAGIEIYDPKNRKTFLKKTAMPAVKLEHLFVGATVVVLARTLKIVGYADDATRNRLAAQRERRVPAPRCATARADAPSPRGAQRVRAGACGAGRGRDLGGCDARRHGAFQRQAGAPDAAAGGGAERGARAAAGCRVRLARAAHAPCN